MKVLMTTDTLGGVWTYCMTLCAALQPHGVSIALATMGRKLSAQQHQQLQELPHVQVFESEFRLCWMENAGEDVTRAGDWLLALERDIEPDLVHLNDLAHGGLHWQSPVLLVAHSCVSSWWEAVKKQEAPQEQWRTYQTLVKTSVTNADLVIAPTHAMLVSFLRHYGPAKASLVIPNGRDFPAQIPVSVKIARADPIIFAAGRIWDEAKNIGALTDIAHQLPWPVYLAGDNVDPNGGLKFTDGIHHLGFLGDRELSRWLFKAGIYVAPAHYEPFGLAILEAARAGCALVLGDIRSLREVWADAAEYVNPNNPEAIKDAICRLIVDPQHRRQLSEAAWLRAQRFSATQMAKDYLAQYHALITGEGNFKTPSLPTLLGTRL